MAGIFHLLFKDGISKRWLMHLSGRFCMFEKNRITKISRADTEEGIPEWLLIELLIRLPANSVCRFKVVSKQWLSLISTPYFVHAYVSRASSWPRWTFVSQLYHETAKCCRFPEHPLLMDLHSDVLKCPVSNRVSDKNIFTRIFNVYGVSNGLLLHQCVYKDSRDGVLHANPNICNPITKQFIVLPERFSGFNVFNGWGFLTNVEGGILRSYTVVVFVVHLSRFDVFDSEIGEWKSYTLSTDLRIDNFMLQHRESVDVDGILHWISPENGIIAYDHQRNPDVLRVIAFPTDNPLQDVQGRFRMCGTYQGCLRYLEYAFWTRSLCVWVLNDYGRGDNWSLQHWADFKDDAVLNMDINGKRSDDICIDLTPIHFHPLDSDIVYFGGDTFFVSYDMRARKMQILKTLEDPKEQARHIPWFQAIPFLIPPLPVSMPSSLRYLNCSHPQSHCS